MFKQDAQNGIEINALEFGYNQMYLEEIKELKEKNKAENIVTLKGMMKAFNVDFDTAFTVSGFDSSLKEEYRRLVEE